MNALTILWGNTRRAGERALNRAAEFAWSARSPLRQAGAKNWEDWVTLMSSIMDSVSIARRVGATGLARIAELAWFARSPLRRFIAES